MRRRMKSPTYATVPEAIRFLASCCDGARARDGYGFNRDHVEIGHALAQLPDQYWDVHAKKVGRALTLVYRAQLARAGFDIVAIQRGANPPRISSRHARRLAPQWAIDPTGLHRWRWWNGARWTHYIAN